MSRKIRRTAQPASKAAKPAPRKSQQAATTTPLIQRAWAFPALLFVIGLAIYWPAVDGPFILDDFDLMEAASAVRSDSLSALISTGRPLLTASFRWNLQAVGGFASTTWYHLPNSLLHGLNAILLWLFWRTVCRLENVRSETSESLRHWLTYGVPLLFLVLPIQSESVAYISSRSNVLSTTFYLGALCLFASPWRLRRRWLVTVGVLLLTGGAALSKQDKVTLPAAILLLDYLVLSGRDWRQMVRSWPTYGLFAISGVGGFFVLIKPFLFAPSAGFTLDWTTYLFTQFRMYFRYLRLIFVPVGLNLDHDIEPSRSIFDHGSWLAMVVLAAVIGAAIYFHRKMPLLSFSVLFFFLAMAPSSSFYPLLDFFAERHVYLGIIGLLAAAFYLIDRFVKVEVEVVTTALIALGVVYGAATFQRAGLWGDDLALWQDAAEKSPNKVRPWNWLGKTQYEQGLVNGAQRTWLHAEEIVDHDAREYPAILMNLGLSYAKQKNYEKAAEYYERTLAAEPENAVAWAQLAVTQMRLDHTDAGWESFEKAGQFGEGLPEVRRLRGQEYFLIGRCSDAYNDFLGASQLRPEDPSLRQNVEAARQCRDRAQQQ